MSTVYQRPLPDWPSLGAYTVRAQAGAIAVELNSRVWCAGVFDSVSSLGWIWDDRSLPNTANNPAIDQVRHAMAIDESRFAFR